MANTTNFGWETPDDTDLVKDGAAAIRTLGSAIDTSLVDLKGGTTGQVLAKNSNTDMDFVWSADAAGMTNPMTTTGDTIYSSSGSTPARLGIGSTGQVLTVAAGLPSWSTPSSGAMTLIQRSTFSDVATTSTTFDGVFTSTYKTYQIVIENIFASTGSDDLHFQWRYSGTTETANEYIGNRLSFNKTTTTTTNSIIDGVSQYILNANAGNSGFPSSGTFFVNRVGSGNRSPIIIGTSYSIWDHGTNMLFGSDTSERTYTGFLLKSSSTNISGTVAVYGLA